MANGERSVGIIGKLADDLILFLPFIIFCAGGTIKKELRTFASSLAMPGEPIMQHQEELVQ